MARISRNILAKMSFAQQRTDASFFLPPRSQNNKNKAVLLLWFLTWVFFKAGKHCCAVRLASFTQSPDPRTRCRCSEVSQWALCTSRFTAAFRIVPAYPNVIIAAADLLVPGRGPRCEKSHDCCLHARIFSCRSRSTDCKTRKGY